MLASDSFSKKEDITKEPVLEMEKVEVPSDFLGGRRSPSNFYAGTSLGSTLGD